MSCHATRTLVAVATAILSTCAVNADNTFNGGVRGYDAALTSAPSIITLSEPLPSQERAGLGSPAVLAIVVGCVAAIALAIALAYRSRTSVEPSTPRDDDADTSMSVVSSTKSIETQYQQSFDGPHKPQARPLEPQSPKMPPPPLQPASHPQGQRRFSPQSPTLSSQLVGERQPTENRPVDVVVVAM